MNISELQKLICQMRRDKKLETKSILQLCLGLGEEVGELFKAVREHEGFELHQDTERHSIPDELADCFVFLCAIAEWYGLDLGDIAIEKMRKDEMKVYNKIN